jgi:hypothetical protein
MSATNQTEAGTMTRPRTQRKQQLTERKVDIWGTSTDDAFEQHPIEKAACQEAKWLSLNEAARPSQLGTFHARAANFCCFRALNLQVRSIASQETKP